MDTKTIVLPRAGKSDEAKAKATEAMADGAEVLKVSADGGAVRYSIEAKYPDGRINLADPDPPFALLVKMSVRVADGDDKATQKIVVETFEDLTLRGCTEIVNERSQYIKITPAVVEKMAHALAGQKAAKAIAEQLAQTKDFFATLVEIVKSADDPEKLLKLDDGPERRPTDAEVRVARDKLQVFGSQSNPMLGMKLAQMSRRQRQAFAADVRHGKANAKRAGERRKRLAKKRKARR